MSVHIFRISFMRRKTFSPAGYTLSIYVSRGGSFIDAVIQQGIGVKAEAEGAVNLKFWV